MFELTKEQRHELKDPEPLAIDPETRQTYVLVRREAYERLKALLALDDYDPDEGAAYINEVMAEDDAKEPYLGSYQHYRRPGLASIANLVQGDGVQPGPEGPGPIALKSG